MTPLIRFSFLVLTWVLCGPNAPGADTPPAHLFILSGQSNMENLHPQSSFIPTLKRTFGANQIIVVKEAKSGRAIRGWVKDWTPEEGPMPEDNGDVYDRLIESVKKAIQKKQIQTVTFIWMQGERDAKEGQGNLYRESLDKLIDQLKADLGRDEINLVIGRLSDYDLQNEKAPHWTLIRTIQTEFVRDHPRSILVSTDDLNDSLDYEGNEINNDLHLSEQGYTILGQRFADAAISLIRTP